MLIATRKKSVLPIAWRLLWMLSCGTLRAEPALTQWVHEQWQTDRGLPQNSIFCFTQDARGFLWCGTESGLVRFDSAEFKLFTPQDSAAIQHNFVSSVLVAEDGSIWAGTRTGGLLRFHDEKFTTPFPELNQEKVFGLAQTGDGTIWIAAWQGLLRALNGQLELIPRTGGSSTNRPNAICAASDGSVWIGNSGGEILRYADERLAQYVNPFAIRESAITAIAEDPNSGTIWVAYDGDGLFRFAGGTFSRVDLTGREMEYLQALFVDAQGAAWVGTEQDGIIRCGHGRVSAFGAQDGLTTESVLSLFRDRDGSMWAGTLFGGLHRLRRGAFSTYGPREGFNVETVTCILEKTPAELWIGTKSDGLFRKAGEIFSRIPTPGLSREIRAILRTREGEIWVGGKDGGVLRFEPDGSTSMLHVSEGLAANDVTLFYQTSEGSIWIGSQRNGVTIFDPQREQVSKVLASESLRSYIRCITQDPDGAVWIGTQNGLFKYHQGSLEPIELGRFSEGSIRALFFDRDGTLWMGTRDDGLLRFERGKLFQFDQRVGLVHSRIYHVLNVDDTLWLAGNRGIESVNLGELQAVAAGKQPQILSRLYTEHDGLRTVECTGDASPSAIATSDGSLWFGTRRGLAQFTAKDLPRPLPIPRVVIERVRLDRDTVPAREFRKVPAGTTRVQFSYTAPALAQSGQVQYCYKLEGVDKDWIEAGREREAVYYHLRPGRYKLTVSASHSKGVWSEEPTTLAFSVEPRFYQTAWFFLLALGIGAGGVRTFYRWRQQIALNAALECRVKERTAELSHAYENLQNELFERKRVEEELASSEARLRRVVDSGMVGILFWTPDGRILDANDTFLQMIGYTRDELAAGKIFWKDLTPPEYAHLDISHIEEIRQFGVCAPFEKEYVRKDGTRFPVLLGGASLKKDISEGVCFVLDISERKASEEQVKHLAQSLEARVQERTRELGFMNEQLATEVLERKRVAVALSAFSQLGQKLHGTRTEAEAANIIALTAKSLIPHDICSIELYGPDSKLYPVISTASPSQDPNAEPMRSSISVPIRNGSRVIGVIGLQSTGNDAFQANDASTLQALGDYCGGALDRIHAEEARRETERRFVAFMTNAPALAWMKDAHFRYVFTNPMFQNFLGLSASEIEGKSDLDLWSEAYATRIRTNDLKVFTGETTVQTEETVRRANEDTRTLLTFRFPFTTATGERFIAGMAIDISEQKRAEEALHRLPQAILEAQEQERHRLARELHDGVNQAIASAKFRIQTAENQILRGDQKWQESCSKSKQMLDSVLQQVRRLSHNLRPGELDDLGLLAAARTAFREFEERTGIQVNFTPSIEGRLDPSLESTFYRVIQEALTNIEKHSSATVVDVSITQNETGVSLEISDNGIGFDSAHVENSRLGLGLLHMRERATLVGAGFSVRTAPGDGVRLSIHVPTMEERQNG